MSDCWFTDRTYSPIKKPFPGWGEAIDSIGNLLSDLELSPPAGSRLWDYLKHLKEAVAVESDHEHVLQLASIWNELYYLYECSQYLDRSSDGLRDKVSASLSGATWANRDKNKNARSAQSELYFASALCSAGFSVSFCEPDIIAARDSFKVCVAVKRINSEKKLFENARIAAKQCKPFRHLRVMAIDVTPIWLQTKPTVIDQHDRVHPYPIHSFLNRMGDTLSTHGGTSGLDGIGTALLFAYETAVIQLSNADSVPRLAIAPETAYTTQFLAYHPEDIDASELFFRHFQQRNTYKVATK